MADENLEGLNTEIDTLQGIKDHTDLAFAHSLIRSTKYALLDDIDHSRTTGNGHVSDISGWFNTRTSDRTDLIATLKGQVSGALAVIDAKHTDASASNGRAGIAMTDENLAGLNTEIDTLQGIKDHTDLASAHGKINSTKYALLDDIDQSRATGNGHVSDISGWFNTRTSDRTDLIVTLKGQVSGALAVIDAKHTDASASNGRAGIAMADENLEGLNTEIGTLQGIKDHTDLAFAHSLIRSTKYALLDDIDQSRATGNGHVSDISGWFNTRTSDRTDLIVTLKGQVSGALAVIDAKHTDASASNGRAGIAMADENLEGLNTEIDTLQGIKDHTDLAYAHGKINSTKYALLDDIDASRTTGNGHVSDISGWFNTRTSDRADLITTLKGQVSGALAVIDAKHTDASASNGRAGIAMADENLEGLNTEIGTLQGIKDHTDLASAHGKINSTKYALLDDIDQSRTTGNGHVSDISGWFNTRTSDRADLIVTLKGQVSGALAVIDAKHTDASASNGRAGIAMTDENLAGLNTEIDTLQGIKDHTDLASAHGLIRSTKYALLDDIDQSRTAGNGHVSDISGWFNTRTSDRADLITTLKGQVSGALAVIDAKHTDASASNGRAGIAMADENLEGLNTEIDTLRGIKDHTDLASAHGLIRSTKYALLDDIDQSRTTGNGHVSDISGWFNTRTSDRTDLITALKGQVSGALAVIDAKHTDASASNGRAGIAMANENLEGLNTEIDTLQGIKDHTDLASAHSLIRSTKYALLDDIDQSRTTGNGHVSDISGWFNTRTGDRTDLIAALKGQVSGALAVIDAKHTDASASNGRAGIAMADENLEGLNTEIGTLQGIKDHTDLASAHGLIRSTKYALLDDIDQSRAAGNGHVSDISEWFNTRTGDRTDLIAAL